MLSIHKDIAMHQQSRGGKYIGEILPQQTDKIINDGLQVLVS